MQLFKKWHVQRRRGLMSTLYGVDIVPVFIRCLVDIIPHFRIYVYIIIYLCIWEKLNRKLFTTFSMNCFSRSKLKAQMSFLKHLLSVCPSGSYICSNEGPGPFSSGDNSEKGYMYWWYKKHLQNYRTKGDWRLFEWFRPIFNLCFCCFNSILLVNRSICVYIYALFWFWFD